MFKYHYSYWFCCVITGLNPIWLSCVLKVGPTVFLKITLLKNVTNTAKNSIITVTFFPDYYRLGNLKIMAVR